MNLTARRVAAVFGGVVFGFAVGASIPTFATVNNETSIGLGGFFSGHGVGLMVAALGERVTGLPWWLHGPWAVVVGVRDSDAI